MIALDGGTLVIAEVKKASPSKEGEGVDVTTATRDDVAAAWKQRDVDWIGDVVDFVEKTIRCRPRHIDASPRR